MGSLKKALLLFGIFIIASLTIALITSITNPPVEKLEKGYDGPAIERAEFDLQKFKEQINNKDNAELYKFFDKDKFTQQDIESDFTFDYKTIIIVEKNKEEDSYRHVSLKILNEDEYKNSKITKIKYLEIYVDTNSKKITQYNFKEKNKK